MREKTCAPLVWVNKGWGCPHVPSISAGSTVPLQGRGKPVEFECEKPQWEWNQCRVVHPSQPLDLRIPLHRLQMDTGSLSIISRWTSETCLAPVFPPQDHVCPTPAFCAGLRGSSWLLCRQERALQLTCPHVCSNKSLFPSLFTRRSRPARIFRQ